MGDAVADVLEEGRFAGFWRRDDQTSLPFADGGDQVDDPGGEIGRSVFQIQFFIGKDRREGVEVLPPDGDAQWVSVNGVDIQKDNTLETIERIVTTVEKVYEKAFHCLPDALVTDAVRKIAFRNIVWGNTLAGETGDGDQLSFHEWDIREDGSIMSKEYALTDMIRHNGVGTQPMCRHTYRWLTSVNKETA